MAFPFAAIAAAVIPKLIGGLIDKDDNRSNRNIARDQAAQDYARDLAQYKKAKKNDRDYAYRVTQRDRAYAEKIAASDRKYAEGIAAKERKLALSDEARRLQEYKDDRDFLQGRSDRYAKATTASRGINFQKLRDQAVAAGFNPLTALQFANQYSTEVGYGVVGGPASGQAAGGAGVPVGGTSVVGSTVAPSQAFQSGGAGYGAVPAFTSNAFIGDALGAGVDAYFNAVAEDKAQYENIAAQVAAGQLERYRASMTPRDFGYDLSKIQPFQPDVTSGYSHMQQPDHFVAATGIPIALTPNRTSAQEVSDRYGDLAEDAWGIGLAVEDGARNVGSYVANQTKKGWYDIFPEGTFSEWFSGARPLNTPLLHKDR